MSLAINALRRLVGSQTVDAFNRERSINSYQEFIDYLYRELDKAIAYVETKKDQIFNFGEDQITGYILARLERDNISADHDSSNNGHPDIKIKWGDHVWLAEAKIVNSNYDAMEGWRQLVDRYASGGIYQDRGCLLLYFKNSNAYARMRLWREYLSGCDVQELRFQECSQNRMCFYTIHNHRATGLPFEVRHTPVSLFFEPTDRSARATAQV